MLDKKISNISKERIDFGSIPNGSAIDLDSFQKIDKAITENKFRLFDNYKDMMMLINFLIKVTFMFRGHDEHKDICWSNFKFSTVESGKFAG